MSASSSYTPWKAWCLRWYFWNGAIDGKNSGRFAISPVTKFGAFFLNTRRWVHS